MSINRIINLMLVIVLVWSINLYPAYAEEDGELYSPKIEKAEGLILADRMKSAVRENKKETKKKEQNKKEVEKPKWESLGDCRVTYYCPGCNDPCGYESSSGETLREGYVACNWLSNGTIIKINGVEYTVMDYCGTEAIDIFVDTDACYCNDNYYTEVMIKRR